VTLRRHAFIERDSPTDGLNCVRLQISRQAI
jgi:hypothetical protein